MSDDDFDKLLDEKINSNISQKLFNLFTSTNEVSNLRVLLASTVQNINFTLKDEIQKVIGKELNDAKKQLSLITSPKIAARVNEFEYQIYNLLKEHTESITTFQEETLSKFRSKVLPISNLHIVTDKIKVGNRINAEEYVRTKLEGRGFKVVKQSCDAGVPDFAVYKKIGEDKNLLEMDVYDLIIQGETVKHPKLETTQNTIDIDAPSYSKYPLFIEVKTNGDGLRMNQLAWIRDHPDSKVIVYCVEQVIS